MTLKRCNSCQGEYDDIAPDGMLYFHSCPPVTKARVQRGGRAQIVDLRDVQPTDTVLEHVQVARPDARDENAATTGGDEELDPRGRNGRRQIKARGGGATPITR